MELGFKRSQAVVSRSDDNCVIYWTRRETDDFTFGELTVRQVGVSASRPATDVMRRDTATVLATLLWGPAGPTGFRRGAVRSPEKMSVVCSDIQFLT